MSTSENNLHILPSDNELSFEHSIFPGKDYTNQRTALKSFLTEISGCQIINSVVFVSLNLPYNMPTAQIYVLWNRVMEDHSETDIQECETIIDAQLRLLHSFEEQKIDSLMSFIEPTISRNPELSYVDNFIARLPRRLDDELGGVLGYVTFTHDLLDGAL